MNAIGRVVSLLAKMDKARSCGRKVDYKRKDTAQRAAIRMHDKNGSKLEPYPCHYCGGWHIGHPFGKKRW